MTHNNPINYIPLKYCQQIDWKTEAYILVRFAWMQFDASESMQDFSNIFER
jgi:hypothetical protein